MTQQDNDYVLQAAVVTAKRKRLRGICYTYKERHWKLELPASGSQAGAWEPA